MVDDPPRQTSDRSAPSAPSAPSARSARSASSESTLRVFIVEDDARTRDLLCTGLGGEPGVMVVGSASTASDALRLAPAAEPDVVIVDLALGSESGVDVIRELRALAPKAELMAHTVFDDRDIVLRALKAGAASYLLKGTSTEEMCRALHDLKDGGAPMSPRIARLVIVDLQAVHGAQPAPDPLSPRERQVLRCIDEGLTYKEIAQRLSISVHTVHGHIKGIYEQLQARGRKEALASARVRGLI
jgi:DNA-binding NarL/FixJ family response regulator